jgi:hypothetical protein
MDMEQQQTERNTPVIMAVGTVVGHYPMSGHQISGDYVRGILGKEPYLDISSGDPDKAIKVYGNWNGLTQSFPELHTPVEVQIEEHPKLRNAYRLIKDTEGRPAIRRLPPSQPSMAAV